MWNHVGPCGIGGLTTSLCSAELREPCKQAEPLDGGWVVWEPTDIKEGNEHAWEGQTLEVI